MRNILKNGWWIQTQYMTCIYVLCKILSLNSLPHMPILGPSIPIQQHLKILGQKYWQMGIQLFDWVENIVGKEKLLRMSNFSFSHNVFKSYLLLMWQNEYLWSKGLKKDTFFSIAFSGREPTPFLQPNTKKPEQRFGKYTLSGAYCFTVVHLSVFRSVCLQKLNMKT